ncbi:LOW QUALITY PROTEIN: uncharacterized protein LOC115004966 [Cottoperca gobio]|uniref:LOW QUALITY PROTEIN: uncharacterized protein LOC115004966 n=1 Tax=Cottoperca gobio TaxID=56716 RepID=A0A6J2P985_COTGO|nr:LOW QUALITY PROTEIN: uncharacterized protein LOC115004966 [Cottoperca gobio]
MASTAFVTPDPVHDKSSRPYLVTWMNNLLKTSFKDVRQMGSGACYCQITHWVIPGSLEISKVKFDVQSEDDCKHNFSLLHEAFSKSGITKMIPVEELINGDPQINFEIMKWFKAFYLANVNVEDYDPVKARGGRDISPTGAFPALIKEKSKLDSEEEVRTGPKEFPFSEHWMDIFDWAEHSELGERFTFCRSCNRSLKTFSKGLVELRRHVETNKHKKRVQMYQRSVLQSHLSDQLPCSDAAVRFIHQLCCSGSAEGELASQRFARCKLGLQYPKDITSVCQHTPYCVYIYGGETLGEDDTVSVVLVGFFDVGASRHRIRFLDALQSEDRVGEKTAAAVVETLKNFGLPTHNLAAVYSDGNGAASEHICTQLRELNPNIVSVGGLYAVADAALHAGIKELSNQAQELMVDMHAHHSSCSSQNDNLTALFVSDISADRHLNTSCLTFCLFVTHVLEVWTDLIMYFKSCNKEDKKAKLISSQLQDPKVRATFMFLEHALKPLHTFQRQLQTPEGAARADMLLVLEEASSLLCTYTSYFLQPEAAARFAKERDAQILKDKKFHLSSPELSLGGGAVEDVTRLQEEALAFYVALTGCVAEQLPLSDELLRSIALLLNPRSRLTLTGKVVRELGTELDICSSPEEVEQLTGEFLEYQLSETDSAAGASLEEHWARVLKDTKPASVFRQLVLTLLSLPCPPLQAQQLFAQALDSEDAALLSETEDSECDLTSSADAPCRRNATVHAEGLKDLNVSVKRCEVRLTKINDDACTAGENGHLWKEMPIRGSYGWESSLRQKPQARAVFQAGAATCFPPEGDDKDSKTQDEVAEETSPFSKRTPRGRGKQAYQDGKGFLTGELVWGKVKGFSWWPGMVMPWKTKSSPPGMRRVEWFGDGMFSEIYTEGLMIFSAFTKCFCKNSFASLPVYKEAVYQIIELAGERCAKSFSEAEGKKESELKLMLSWASEGFLPTGPEGFLPPDAAAHQDSSDSAMSDYQPPAKRKYVLKSKAVAPIITYNRESIREKVKEKGKHIEAKVV